MKLLVTGGAGYIGSVVSAQLVEAGHEVTVLDDLSSGFPVAIPTAATFVQARVHDAIGDILTPDAGYDGVLHFAAFIAAGESVDAPAKYWDNNVTGSLRLLEAVRAAGVPRLVFSSTANVYGTPDEVPIRETARMAPPNPYATSKLAVEYALAGWCTAYGLAATSLRYFNASGAYIGAPGGDLGERHNPETHLIPIALQVAAGRRDKLQLFGDDYPTPDGTCIRDYIHVTDLATAHLLALTAATAGEHHAYNLGSGTGFSNRQVIDVVRQVTGHPIPTETAPRRPGDPAVLVASPDKARAALGWVPARPNLADIVADSWAFYQSILD